MIGNSEAIVEKGTHVIFGVSNMFSDFVDCVDALGSVVSQVVLNLNDVVHSNALSLGDCLKLLAISPKICRFEGFSKEDSEKYIIDIMIITKKSTAGKKD